MIEKNKAQFPKTTPPAEGERRANIGYHGKFAFRQNDERRRGYRSNYMYKRRKRYEAKPPAKEREPSVSPVPNPGKETGKKPDEDSKKP